jgi:hypothetical protein
VSRRRSGTPCLWQCEPPAAIDLSQVLGVDRGQLGAAQRAGAGVGHGEVGVVPVAGGGHASHRVGTRRAGATSENVPAER